MATVYTSERPAMVAGNLIPPPADTMCRVIADSKNGRVKSTPNQTFDSAWRLAKNYAARGLRNIRYGDLRTI